MTYIHKCKVTISVPSVSVSINANGYNARFVFVERHRPTLCLKVVEYVGAMLENGI